MFTILLKNTEIFVNISFEVSFSACPTMKTQALKTTDNVTFVSKENKTEKSKIINDSINEK